MCVNMIQIWRRVGSREPPVTPFTDSLVWAVHPSCTLEEEGRSRQSVNQIEFNRVPWPSSTPEAKHIDGSVAQTTFLIYRDVRKSQLSSLIFVLKERTLSRPTSCWTPSATQYWNSRYRVYLYIYLHNVIIVGIINDPTLKLSIFSCYTPSHLLLSLSLLASLSSVIIISILSAAI